MAERITESEGPDPQDEEIEHFAGEWPRLLGQAAARQGVATEMLLGLMDGGATLDQVIEALVMHGELPAFLERPRESADELRLVESPDQGWRVAS